MRKNQKAFTLIELLVVISIIGLLASVVLLALTQARTKARDARRIADLKQIANAMELYNSKFNAYPLYINNSSPPANFDYMIADLHTNGLINEATVKEIYALEKPTWWENWFTPKQAFALSYSGGGHLQDPQSPTRTYDYMANANRSAYRLRANLENGNNPALSKSLTGAFQFAGTTSGGSACDTSLNYYCIGTEGTFVPGP